MTEIQALHAAHHAVGRLHRDGADAVLAEVLFHFSDDVDRARPAVGPDSERVVDLRQVARLELDVDDGADHLNDLADSRLAICFLATAPPRLTPLR